MKHRFSFFIFIGVIGMAGGLGEWFMYRQGLAVLQPAWTLAIFLLAPFTFVVPNVAEKHLPHLLTKLLSIIGGFWFIFCYYSLGFLLLYFILYGVSLLFPQAINWQIVSPYFSVGSFLFIIVVISLGTWNAFHPVYRKATLLTNKPLPKNIRIAFISDIHLGTILGKIFSKKLAENINTMQPDLVILGGDIIDGNLEFVIKDKSYENLKKIKSAWGNYAVYGNHDYYGGDINKEQQLLAPTIQFLKDKSVLIEDMIQIVGLDDFIFNPRNKVPLQDNKFLNILVDHEPWRIREAAAAGYDLYLAGHTHAGQFFPNRMITKKIYDLDYGSKMFGNMLTIVSNGYGFWGIPVRIGPAPEIVIIEIKNN